MTRLPRIFAISSLFLAALASSGCGPTASRGGEGTENPNMDQPAMSTQLDQTDILELVDKNLAAMSGSTWWVRDVTGAADPPVIAIWPIMNATSEHIDDQMGLFLSEIETSLVNIGSVRVVSRERQHEMADEVGVQAGGAFNPETAAKIGRQVGAKYYITGKVTSVDERIKNTRRVQYSLFLQVLEIETSMVMFKFTSKRSKAVKG